MEEGHANIVPRILLISFSILLFDISFWTGSHMIPRSNLHN